MRRLLLVLTLSLSLTGGLVGTAQAAYPKSVKREFVKGCVDAGGTKRQCQCTIRKLEKRYSYKRFLALAERVAETGKLPKGWQRIINACA